MSGQVEADLKPLSFLTMTYSSFASVCFARIGNPFFLLWPRLCRRTSSLRGWNFYKALPNQPKHVRVSTSCSADWLAEINPAQLTERLWKYSTLKIICTGRCHTISAKPRIGYQCFDVMTIFCELVRLLIHLLCQALGSSVTMQIFGFLLLLFFKLITLPCRLRVDNVLWFHFKNRWKPVFTTFDWCTASQLIWHTQSLTLSSVLSGNIGGYITFKSARKKNKKK